MRNRENENPPPPTEGSGAAGENEDENEDENENEKENEKEGQDDWGAQRLRAFGRCCHLEEEIAGSDWEGGAHGRVRCGGEVLEKVVGANHL